VSWRRYRNQSCNAVSPIVWRRHIFMPAKAIARSPTGGMIARRCTLIGLQLIGKSASWRRNDRPPQADDEKHRLSTDALEGGCQGRGGLCCRVRGRSQALERSARNADRGIAAICARSPRATSATEGEAFHRHTEAAPGSPAAPSCTQPTQPKKS
jgi:hypothetical protein